MQSLNTFLTNKFNLLEGEASAYLKLVEIQPSTVLKLSKATGLNRITVHGYVNNLIEKGLISQTKSGSRRLLIAEPPEKLRALLQERKDEISKIEKNLPKVINSIKSIIPKNKKGKDVAIKYYEGKKEVKIIYDEAIKSNEFRAYVNVSQLEKSFPNNVKLFLQAHKENNNMKIWEIMENSKAARSYANAMPDKRYYYKFIPPNMDFSVIDYMIFDNKVGIVDLKKSTSGILITNKSYYNNAKAIFDFVWQVLPS